ncbi:MAG: Wzz/FepE/Etk N-terminal domain-containing protein [Dorea longicatena]
MYNVVRDVLKNWWVILFIAISVSLLTYIGAAWMYHPTYTSSTTFVVSAKGSSTGAYANQSQTEKLTDTFQSVMNSQILKKKVSESLKMDTFPGTVKIAVVPETNLLTVSVTSGSRRHRSSFLRVCWSIIRMCRRMCLVKWLWKYSRNRIFRRRQMWHSREVM